MNNHDIYARNGIEMTLTHCGRCEYLIEAKLSHFDMECTL